MKGKGKAYRRRISPHGKHARRELPNDEGVPCHAFRFGGDGQVCEDLGP